MDFVPKNPNKVEDAVISGFTAGEDLNNASLINIGMVGAPDQPSEIVNVSFNYSFMDRCYFRNVVFRRCSFIGARFERSNFRQCRFVSCNFAYAFFSQTILPIDSIEDMLPDRPNVSRELLRILRANAVSVGDYDSQNRCITLELSAQTEYYRRAIHHSEQYYRDKYNTIWKRTVLMRNASVNLLERFLWGHGEGIWRLVFSTVLLIIFLALSATVPDLSKETSALSAWISIKTNFFDTLLLFLDVQSDSSHFNVYYSCLVVSARYTVLGLLFSAVFRRLSHR